KAIDAFFEELLTAQDTPEKIVGLYGVLRPALLDAYRLHYQNSHPVIDYPTRRMLKYILLDEEDQMTWGQAAVSAVTESPEQKARAEAWTKHLQAYLQNMGGIMGDQEKPVSL
ncbi:hypothetical protein JZU71_05465, partial [bacterium]|nr:hypothetical protein [bacterium]